MAHRLLAASVGIAAMLLPSALPAQTAPAPQPQQARIEPRAIAAFEAMTAALRKLKTFELRALSTTDEVLENDLKIETTNYVDYQYGGPDKLFVDWRSDRRVRQLFFDGRTLTVFAPRSRYYASLAEPGTVGEVLERVAQKYDLVFPLPDLFRWAVRSAAPYNFQEARYVGYARIAGVDTDHYVFRQPELDWQMWVERGARPLPRKIVIVTRDDPDQPKFSALLKWNPDVPLTADRFTFKPQSGAMPIEVLALRKKD